MEQILSMTQARGKFTELVKNVQFNRDMYVITFRGEPASADVAVQVYGNWKRQREALFEQIRATQQEAGLEPEAAERLVDEAVQESRPGLQ